MKPLVSVDGLTLRQGSQRYKIYNYLKAGHRITPLEALRKFRSFRLASVISDLRKRGVPIERRMVRTRGGAMIAEYYLQNENR